MKYWKLKDNSAVESHSDNVNISAIANEITKAEFETYIAALPAPAPQPDYKALYAAAVTTDQKLTVIANMLRIS